MAIVPPAEEVGFIDFSERKIAAFRASDKIGKGSDRIPDGFRALLVVMEPFAVGVANVTYRANQDWRWFCGTAWLGRSIRLKFAEIVAYFCDGSAEWRDATVLDEAELAIAGLPDQASFNEEAIASQGGLLVRPEVVHLAINGLAVLSGSGMVSNLIAVLNFAIIRSCSARRFRL